MRKSLSLMLSAALVAASATGAPIARKATLKAAGAAEAKSVTQTVSVRKGTVKTGLYKTKSAGMARAVKAGARINMGGTALRRQEAVKSATAASRAASAASLNLRGVVMFADSWAATQEAEYGLYKIPTAPGAAFEQLFTSDYPLSYGSVDNGEGVYAGAYLVDFFGMFQMPYVTTYNTDDWTQLSDDMADDMSCMAAQSALDPVTGKVYGYFYNAEGTGFNWAVADFAGMTSTAIAPATADIMALGVDENGQYYAIDFSGKLSKLDKATGTLTEIGNTGLSSDYKVGGCVYNGKFYVTTSTDTAGSLYEVDLATAQATLLTDFADNEEVCGLYVAKPLAADKAPAAPSLTAVCNNGSMDVALTLVMPETLFDGTPAAGQTFSYTILANGVEVATGSAAAGSTVSKTVTMTESGVTEFVASVSNADGTSPKGKASCYVGKGTPAAPAKVDLTWADGTASLSWNAVTASADGGYIDPAAVTYTVLDADGAEAATGLTATTWSAPLPEPADTYKAYTYSVKAVYDGKASLATKSNAIGLGAYSAPVTIDLDGADVAEKFAEHIVLDANADGKTWTLYSNTVRYSYHSSNTADDWLMSPAVKLEAGKVYTFKARAHASGSSYPERLEVKAGQGSTPADMTMTVVEPTVVNGNDNTELTAMLQPAATGVYFIGFHAVSDPDMNALTLVDYEIGAPMAPDAPAACTNITVTPDFDGALKAAIELTAPKLSIAGNPLSGQVTIKVLRDGTQIKELTVAAGTKYSFSDQVAASGTYTYTFEASNAAGQGLSATASAFIGPRKPASVSLNSATLKVTAPNTLQLDWQPVTTDVDGQPINPANVTYNVYAVVEQGGSLALGDQLNDAPLTATTFTTTAQLPEEQDFYYLGLQAVNGDVAGGAIAVSTVVGTPYEMPVLYTDEASLGTFFLYYGGTTDQRGSLSLGSEESLGIPGADDDCYFAIKHTNAQAALGTKTYISTGLIAISGDAPVLNYYDYRIDGEDGSSSQNETEVTVLCDGQETLLKKYAAGELPQEGWNKVSLDLSAFKGKTVMIQIGGVLRSHLYNLYDAVEVKNLLANDLSVAISAPAKVETGKEFEVAVTVSNMGSQAAPATSVNLLCNGEVVATLPVEALAKDASKTVTFKQTLGLHADAAEYAATVVYPEDLDLSNNTSATVTVLRLKSNLPGVTGLAGEKKQEGNSLTWDAIDAANLPADAKTEDFENGTSWEHDFAGWTFIDGDGSPVGGFQGSDIPGITPGTTLASFFLFDSSAEQFNATFAAHSGDKYLASLFRYDDGEADDWAISPELGGVAQTISFWARSYSSQYPESIEILYSTSDTDLDSFTLLEAAQTVPGEWTEYTAQLPAGAKYFAIHSCASSSFMLMIDDATYVPAGGVSTLEHVGYNIYRDGVKLNDAPLTAASYLDTEADEAAHTYHVTAVFNRGESELSEPVTINEAGIKDVLSGASAKVAADGRYIVVTGVADSLVTVVSVDGKMLYSAAGDARIPSAPGVYLVTVGRKTVKVAVK